MRIASWAAITICDEDGIPSTPVTKKGVLFALFCNTNICLFCILVLINYIFCIYHNGIVVDSEKDAQHQVYGRHGQSYSNPKVQEYVHPADVLWLDIYELNIESSIKCNFGKKNILRVIKVIELINQKTLIIRYTQVHACRSTGRMRFRLVRVVVSNSGKLLGVHAPVNIDGYI